MNDTICKLMYEGFNETEDYCGPVFDNILCWEPTASGNISYQKCPIQKGLSHKNHAWRKCNDNGTWFNNYKPELTEKGYTNYSGCLKPLVMELYNMCDQMGMDACMKVVGITREIEMVGLSLSLIFIIVALIIFYTHSILKNNRTKIHKNLFIATAIQVVVRLIIYADQRLESSFMERLDYLCEAFHILLEFGKTATIMWTFIEGLYLHNAITFTVFQEHSYIKIYYYMGWIAPQILTFIWIIAMSYVETDECWYLYNFLPVYWILEGPRNAFIVVNLLFLLNIIRILVLKLRKSELGEIQQIRKAVRAAIFLVPLMGTSNILFLVDYRLFKDSWKFAIWSFTTYFLISFQGFFIATLYCLLNGEVRNAVKNSLSLYMSLRDHRSHQKNSTIEMGMPGIDIKTKKNNKSPFLVRSKNVYHSSETQI